MAKKFLHPVFILVICIGCNQSKNGITARAKFDALENLVSTANWQMIDKGDTSYIYFSRIGDELINVYSYALKDGDSSQSILNTIAGKGDSVIWKWNNENLHLTSINEKKAEWGEVINGKDKYVLNKQDSLHISVRFPDGRESWMKKTLPLATFLIRSKYDYENGTHTVDSPIVRPRHLLN